jgi:Na+-transporting NADH:ubiquinone oxidoreductase subunit NqrF
MKIRNGFVSNSSSSSFLIWGAEVKQSDVALPGDMEKYDFIETTGDLVQCAGPDDDYCFYVGRCPSECGGEETMNQFKIRVEKEVQDFLRKYAVSVENLKFGWQSEAWYDG